MIIFVYNRPVFVQNEPRLPMGTKNDCIVVGWSSSAEDEQWKLYNYIWECVLYVLPWDYHWYSVVHVYGPSIYVKWMYGHMEEMFILREIKFVSCKIKVSLIWEHCLFSMKCKRIVATLFRFSIKWNEYRKNLCSCFKDELRTFF